MIGRVKKGITVFRERLALLSIELLLSIILFVAAVAAFVFLARMIFIKERTWFDENAFLFVARHVSNTNTDVMQVFSFLGSHTFLIPANLFIAAYFLIRKNKWYSLKIPVISLAGVVLMFLLKNFFHRQRPLDPLLEPARGHSFPSGHALMSVTFFGILLYLTWKELKQNHIRWAIAPSIIGLVMMIGISRIYLRVHYASDVCAGFAVGIIWLVSSLFILNKIEAYRKKQLVLSRVS